MKIIERSEFNTFGLQVWGGSVNTSFPPHRHNEIEINAIEEGFFTYVLAGREETITAGQIGLFWGAIPHQVVRFAPATRLHWGTIPLDHVLHWDLPQRFIRDLLSGWLFLDIQPLYGTQFFSQWHTDLATGRQSLALMEIRALFFRFAQTTTPNDTLSPASSNRASQMARFMSDHFQEPVTIAQVASIVGLHPNYAMTVFRQTFGLSLIEYLTQQRIAHAQQQLLTGDLPIAEVAAEAGFPTLSHFYSAFHRLIGQAPGKYRAALRRSV